MRAAYDRDDAGGQRDGAAQSRDLVGDRRDELADLRDVAGGHRDDVATRRDSDGRDRDAAAARRDAEFDAIDGRLRSSTPLEREFRAASMQRQSASDRAHAASDRLAASIERSDAEFDREAAHLNRTAGAAERVESAHDRQIAADDRVVSARMRGASALDGLTGVLIRNVGIAALDHEIERVRRSHQPLVVAFVDVDHLKLLNDARGHAAGDELLVEVANHLVARLRSYDVIMRYGGDEFVCVMPGLEIGATTGRFAQVGNDLSALGSISVGFAELLPSDTSATCIARADEAMYISRTAERNG